MTKTIFNDLTDREKDKVKKLLDESSNGTRLTRREFLKLLAILGIAGTVTVLGIGKFVDMWKIVQATATPPPRPKDYDYGELDWLDPTLLGKIRQGLVCLLPGEYVIANPEPKPIESFSAGDYVLSSSGTRQLVIARTCRWYSGPVVTIKTSHLPPVTLTADHPVLAVKSHRCVYGYYDLLCKPDCIYRKPWIKNRGIWYGCHIQLDWTPKWIPASELTIEHFVLFPKYVETESEIVIDLERLCREEGLSVEVLDEEMFTLKYSNRKYRLPRKLKLTHELMEIFGWYLAEGNYDENGIRFSLGWNEREEAQRLVTLIRKVFGVESKIRQIRHTLRIEVNCRALVPLFKQFGRHSREKVIPDFIMRAREDLIRTFLKAYLHGDGHLDPKHEVAVFVTASKKLAWQLILLFSKLGVLPTYIEHVQKGRLPDGRYKPRIVYHLKLYDIDVLGYERAKRHKRRWYYFDGKYFYVPVREIEYSHYEGYVYNLETEDKTYLAPFIVHNCEYLFYEGTGNILHDTSGNSRNATIQDCTWGQLPNGKYYLQGAEKTSGAVFYLPELYPDFSFVFVFYGVKELSHIIGDEVAPLAFSGIGGGLGLFETSPIRVWLQNKVNNSAMNFSTDLGWGWFFDYYVFSCFRCSNSMKIADLYFVRSDGSTRQYKWNIEQGYEPYYPVSKWALCNTTSCNEGVAANRMFALWVFTRHISDTERDLLYKLAKVMVPYLP